MSAADLARSVHYTEAPFPQPAKLARRMRPPDLEIKASMDSGRASRSDKPQKSGKRESRLAFGRLFGRHRAVTETENTRLARDDRDSKESEGISVTIGGTPYDLQGPGLKSEIHLSSLRDVDSASRPRTGAIKSPTFAPPLPSPTMVLNNSKRRGSQAATAWDPVPLFQAWPQAVRTATLPACLQADHLLRLHNKKEMLPSISHPDMGGDDKDMFVAMAKKRHRRSSSSFKLDWTTKIYILVTSGYLLQYAGDGPHDCLPEKVVQLTKDSAAFASDVIPGKHWVLQVSSVFEDGALTSHDTRSLLGKFGLREKERRHASDMLMIFENAADMESWMSLLRREIEVLGGRVPMTEIGTPRQDDDQLEGASPTSPAGRALVMRDPNFARIGSLPDLRWDASITFDGPELHLDAALTELMPDHAFDDNSASNSFVSQDGRQLDGLRDSNNRYSFTSAARTIVTSDSSACNSPVRDSFGSGSQGSHPSEESTPLADDPEDVQLRPNATDIESRRQSYRTSNMFFDPNRQYQTHRQHSSLSVVQEPPNFSLPHPVARRRAASQTASDQAYITTPGRPPRRPRRPPPPTLGFTRPLSVVADSPSPSRSSPAEPMDTDEGFESPAPLDSPALFTRWAGEPNRLGYELSSRASSRQSSAVSFHVPSLHTSRKYASTNSLRPTDNSFWDAAPPRLYSPLREPPLSANDIPQGMSWLDSGISSPPRSRSPIQRAMAAQKRASMYNLSSAPRRGSVPVFTDGMGPDQRDEPFPSPRKGSRLSVPSHSRSGSDASCLSDRRSMPQLPQLALPVGPPPAPPPTKALPPIPAGNKRRSGSIPARRRVASFMAGGGV